MNDGLTIFLNIDEREIKENEALIKRIDELLLAFGMEYTGLRNIYRPIEEKDRDHAIFAACQALNDAVWLKDKLVGTLVMNRASVCSIEQIRTQHMEEPSVAKLTYYENFYQKHYTLAHGIIVDECGQMRDGYTSYIIARKYGIRPDVYEAYAGRPLRKVVKGQHVFRDGDIWKPKNNKIYIWNYTLKSPVVPGDILKVQTRKGQAFICVRQIDYITGEEFCKKHRNVLKHMKERLLPGI